MRVINFRIIIIIIIIIIINSFRKPANTKWRHLAKVNNTVYRLRKSIKMPQLIFHFVASAFVVAPTKVEFGTDSSSLLNFVLIGAACHPCERKTEQSARVNATPAVWTILPVKTSNFLVLHAGMQRR